MPPARAIQLPSRDAGYSYDDDAGGEAIYNGATATRMAQNIIHSVHIPSCAIQARDNKQFHSGAHIGYGLSQNGCQSRRVRRRE